MRIANGKRNTNGRLDGRGKSNLGVTLGALLGVFSAFVLGGAAVGQTDRSFRPVSAPVMAIPESAYQAGFVPTGYHWEPRLDRPAPDMDGQEATRGACPNGYRAGRLDKNMVLAATNSKGWAKRNFLTYRNELGCVQPKKKLITKLPGWFPDSPTPDDIRRLGEQWGPDAAVAVGLTIPMPDLSSCVPATLPTGYLIDVLSQDPITTEWAGGVEGSGKATWRFEGGSGLMYSSLSHIGHPVEDNNAQDAPPDYLSVTYYPALNSEAPLVVTTTSSINIGNRYNSSSEDQTWDVTWDWSAGVVPDCGQANIPQSLIRMWNIPRIAWTDKNRPAPDEYYARTYAGLGPRDVRASPTWPAKHWISEPGTDNN